MSKQKSRKKYYFSVEGQTEELYFKWLQDQINQCPDTSCYVSFDCRVEPDPIKRVKKMNIIGKIEIWHIYDYESNGQEHKKRFFDTIDKMSKAERIGKQVKYMLGYSNLTFDLWMILHKTDCYSSKPYNTAYLKDINKAYDENFQSMDEYKEKDNFNRCLSKINLNDVIQAIIGYLACYQKSFGRLPTCKITVKITAQFLFRKSGCFAMELFVNYTIHQEMPVNFPLLRQAKYRLV